MKYDTIACPFCHDGEIEILAFGGCWQVKRSVTATLGARKNVRKSAVEYVVQSDCPGCGKTAEEIEKKMRE